MAFCYWCLCAFSLSLSMSRYVTYRMLLLFWCKCRGAATVACLRSSESWFQIAQCMECVSEIKGNKIPLRWTIIQLISSSRGELTFLWAFIFLTSNLTAIPFPSLFFSVLPCPKRLPIAMVSFPERAQPNPTQLSSSLDSRTVMLSGAMHIKWNNFCVNIHKKGFSVCAAMAAAIIVTKCPVEIECNMVLVIVNGAETASSIHNCNFHSH